MREKVFFNYLCFYFQQNINGLDFIWICTLFGLRINSYLIEISSNKQTLIIQTDFKCTNLTLSNFIFEYQAYQQNIRSKIYSIIVCKFLLIWSGLTNTGKFTAINLKILVPVIPVFCLHLD